MHVPLFRVEDGSRHRAGVVGGQLDEVESVRHLVTLFVDVVFEQLVALELGVLLGAIFAGVVVHLNGGNVHVDAHASMAEPLIRIERNLVTVIGHDLLDPGMRVGGLVKPHLHDPHVVFSSKRLAKHVVQLDGVDLFARFGALGDIHRAVPVARCAHGPGLLGYDEVDAQVGGENGCGHTGISGSHDKKLGFHGVHDVRFFDLRCIAQPCWRLADGRFARACRCRLRA